MVFLLPAFVVFVWHYVTCDRVAAYYGECQACTEEEELNNEKDQRINDTNRGKNIHNNHKDPTFSRHYLDIYGSRTPSPDPTSKKPVVIFLTGGAWIIGYRMWGTLLGRALAPFGILVFMPDYRNFPRVNIEGMAQDVDMSIQWVLDHCEEYGGDKDKVVLVGQSAGAHIGGVVVGMKVLDWLRRERRAMEESRGMKCKEEQAVDETPLKSTYSPQQLCGFISTSSPHNLVTMRPIFHHHGLSASVQKSIFGGLADDEQSNGAGEEEDVFVKWSPYHLVMKAHEEYLKLLMLDDEKSGKTLELVDVFPRFFVIHGTADKTVPVSEAVEFITLLSKLKIPNEAKLYEGWTHTDPILEAPMRGNHLYHRGIYELVCTWTNSHFPRCANGEKIGKNTTVHFDEKHPMLQPICPSVLVEAARFCNPF